MSNIVEVNDILIGPIEAADFFKEISAQPLGARTIASYAVNNRIPVLKSGSTNLFSKTMLKEWDKAGRPNLSLAVKTDCPNVSLQ